MWKRANQLWLVFFLPGALLIVGHFVLTRVFGLVLSEFASSVVGGLGIVLLLLSLLTQLPRPRRRRRDTEG
ncbi:MAG: hypothetical protein RMK01_02175 [Thermomicrobium sp.]|nr:hypothetical protein [Thermomicrobium sp.]